MPFAHREWFLAHGIEVNDPQFLRWVEGTPRRTYKWFRKGDKNPNWRYHQSWCHEYSRRFKEFIDNEPASGYTKQQVIDFKNGLVGDYPDVGLPRQ